MGRREQALFDALLRNGYWARRCGWNYSTEGETRRMLRRLAEKGYVDIQQPGPLFVPTNKGRRVRELTMAASSAGVNGLGQETTGS